MSRFIESFRGKPRQEYRFGVVAETSQVTYNECSANSVSGGWRLSFIRTYLGRGRPGSH